MPSQKLSQMTALDGFASSYDRLAVITPTVDSNGVQTGGSTNVTVPYRAMWSPTMLVELTSDTDEVTGDETLGPVPNNWLGTMILNSDECTWSEQNKEFQFLVPGLFEVNVVGEVYTKDSSGNIGLIWPTGTSQLSLWMDRGYTEVVPRDPANTNSYRVHSKVADQYSNQGTIGFTEKFYFNVVDPTVANSAQFTPNANLTGPNPTDPTLYRSRLAVTIKRIAKPVANLASL